MSTVEPPYYGHQGDRNKCPYYRGARFREVGFIWISVSQGPSELSVIERCPYYRGVRKERFDCTIILLKFLDNSNTYSKLAIFKTYDSLYY